MSLVKADFHLSFRLPPRQDFRVEESSTLSAKPFSAAGDCATLRHQRKSCRGGRRKLKWKISLYTEKDLQDLLLVGKTLEDITRVADTIEKTNGCHTVTEEVNTIADKKWKEKRGGKKYFPRKINHKVGVQIKTCYRCPADDKPCHNCKKLGHFSRCCRSKPQIKENHRPLNTVITTPAISECFESYSETSDNDEYLFAVKQLFVEQDQKLSKFEVNVNLEQSKVKVLIDSGAAVNIMNYKTFGEINKRLEKN